MLKVQIEKPPVLKTSGKGTRYKVQEAWVQLYDAEGVPERYPRRMELMLRESEAGYPPGDYTLAPQSFRVGDYDRLEVGRVALAAAGQARGGTPAGREAGGK